MEEKINREDVVFLSLGGNATNTLQLFSIATKAMENEIGMVILASSLYVTEAWGFKNKTDMFFNQVIGLRTSLLTEEVLEVTQKIEKKLGRVYKATEEYLDRTIDIDILMHGEKVINSLNLTIPHYLLQERKFVLIPFSEIAPNFVHPVFQKTINTLLLQCKDTQEVKKIS